MGASDRAGSGGRGFPSCLRGPGRACGSGSGCGCGPGRDGDSGWGWGGPGVACGSESGRAPVCGGAPGWGGPGVARGSESGRAPVRDGDPGRSGPGVACRSESGPDAGLVSERAHGGWPNGGWAHRATRQAGGARRCGAGRGSCRRNCGSEFSCAAWWEVVKW